MFAAEGVTDILLSWPHWVAEFIVELSTGVVLYPFAKWAWARHDRKVHGVVVNRRVKRTDRATERNVELSTEAIYRWQLQHNHAADRDQCESMARFVVLVLAGHLR